jgi:hypothetical protein
MVSQEIGAQMQFSGGLGDLSVIVTKVCNFFADGNDFLLTRTN